jgi:hypothetical protein
MARVQCINGDWSMLPWLMTFHAARLGLEAQNATAFRFFRLVADRKNIDAIEAADGIARLWMIRQSR